MFSRFHSCHGVFLEFLLGKPFDLAKDRNVPVRHKGESHSFSSSPSCPSYPVDIVFWVHGKVEIDDMADCLNVKTSGSHVGCNHNLHFSGAHLPHSPRALALVHIAVEGGGFMADLPEFFYKIVGMMLCRNEDKGLMDRWVSEKVFEEGMFVGEIVDAVKSLINVQWLACCRLNRDLLGITEKLF